MKPAEDAEAPKTAGWARAGKKLQVVNVIGWILLAIAVVIAVLRSA